MTPPSRIRLRLSNTPAVASLVVWAMLLGLAALAVTRLGPPAVVAADAPLTEFSAVRAMRHVEAIARRPRPVGSEEHARVREYLLRELTALGLSPHVQQTIGVRTTPGVLLAAPIHNIVARVRGTGRGAAIMLAAHYDTVGTSPGASDNAHAVALILETLRALREGPPHQNDLIVLFTDGEEIGLLGAGAFVDGHPWAEDVGLVLNFEARGTHGPAVLFETSTANGRLVGEFLRVTPDPVTNSFMNSLYRRLPNDTDFTMFRESGLSGFNLAFGAGLVRYHTLLDRAEQLDPRSLQHNGSYALALGQRFGDLELSDLQAPDAVFFNVLGSVAVAYPVPWGTGLAVLVLLGLLGTVGLGLRRRALTPPGLIRGFVGLVASVIVAAGSVTLLWWLLTRAHPGYRWFVQGDSYNSALYISAFIALSFSITIWLLGWLRRKASVLDLFAGAQIVWAVCLAATIVLLPEGSYLFTWPLLFSLAGLMLLVSSRNRETISKSGLVVLTASAVPGVLLLASTVYLLFLLTALLVPGVVVIPAVLLIGLLVPQIDLLAVKIRRSLPVVGAALAVGLLVAGSATSGFDKEHPRQNSIWYNLNANTGRSVWASLDPMPDEWTSQFLTEQARVASLREQLPWVKHELLQDLAPPAALKHPEVEIIDQFIGENGMRHVRLRVRSVRSASVIVAWVGSEMTVSGARLGNKRVDYTELALAGGRGTPRLVIFAAPPRGEFELALMMMPFEPVDVNVADVTPGLPALAGFSAEPRPPHMIPKPVPWLSDSTVVSKSFVLPADG